LDLLLTEATLTTKLKLDVKDALGLTDSVETANLADVGLLIPESQNPQPSQFIIKDDGTNLDQSEATQSVQIYGLDGNDTITGSDYADIIRGGVGDDTIDGGAGNDIIIGGKGNDTLTGGLGRDVFRWEAGDQGDTTTPAIDRVTDFDIRSVAQGGDILDFSGLLSDATRVGTNSINISQYVKFVEVTTQVNGVDQTNTEIRISTAGDTINPDQVIVLEGVTDFVEQFASQEELINYLLQSGKLIIAEQTVSAETYGSIKDDAELNLEVAIKDGDGDIADSTHKLNLTVGTLETANQYQPDYDPNNVAPVVDVNM